MLNKDKMREASQLAAHVLEEVSHIIKPGISTLEINDLCHNIIVNNNATPAALNFNGFPKSICTSFNNVVCHGIPSEKHLLRNGDFVNVDVALRLNNHYGDTSRCFKVGKVSSANQTLMSVTYNAMWEGIKVCRNNLPVKHIGKTISSYVKPYGFGIVKDFCGHGIGYNMHEEPEVPANYDVNNAYILKTGMCITIEPMINGGGAGVRILSDNWTVVTKDGSNSAQWEHTIYINEDGCEVMSYNSFDERNQKPRTIKII